MAIIMCLVCFPCFAFADTAAGTEQTESPLLTLFLSVSDEYTENEFFSFLESEDSLTVSYRGTVQTHGGQFYFVSPVEDPSSEIDLIFSPDGTIVKASLYDKPEELSDRETLSACFNCSDIERYYSGTETTGFYVMGSDPDTFPMLCDNASEAADRMYELYGAVTQ